MGALSSGVKMQCFDGRFCFVATQHGKEETIRPSFASLLGLNTVGFPIDTDRFGTFSGEVERKLAPIQCAKEKCLAAFKAALASGKKGCFVASEGTFGPHPLNPFVPCGHEILFFLDPELNLELSLSEIFIETNFSGAAFSDWNEAKENVQSWGFPSHAMIVRPHVGNSSSRLFKGVSSSLDLESAFAACRNDSLDLKVWIETDMRAHKNPTRMRTIGQLAEKLARRLSSPCPACAAPGWGVLRKIPGLCCSYCGSATDLIEIIESGCCRCPHREQQRIEGFADPEFCPRCNP